MSPFGMTKVVLGLFLLSKSTAGPLLTDQYLNTLSPDLRGASTVNCLPTLSVYIWLIAFGFDGVSKPLLMSYTLMPLSFRTDSVFVTWLGSCCMV